MADVRLPIDGPKYRIVIGVLRDISLTYQYYYGHGCGTVKNY